MGTDGALVAVLADKFAEYRHTMPILQTTPAKTRDTPETANLKTDAAYSLTTLPGGGAGGRRVAYLLSASIRRSMRSSTLPVLGRFRPASWSLSSALVRPS